MDISTILKHINGSNSKMTLRTSEGPLKRFDLLRTNLIEILSLTDVATFKW